MRGPLLPLVTVGLAGTFCAAAAASVTAPSVDLVRPAPGEVLVGGSAAVVEWKPDGPLEPGIVEWEAFLSFNGGDYYAVRLTPHLDVSYRRFAFKVPELATDDARILLRFGDEEQEVGVEVRHTFAIRPGLTPSAGAVLRSPGRGEPARPGEAGVVAWMEGSRQGDGLARFEAVPPRCTGTTVSPGTAEPPSVLTPRTDPPALAPAAGAMLADRAPPSPEATNRPRPPTPILLLGCRQNE